MELPAFYIHSHSFPCAVRKSLYCINPKSLASAVDIGFPNTQLRWRLTTGPQ